MFAWVHGSVDEWAQATALQLGDEAQWRRTIPCPVFAGVPPPPRKKKNRKKSDTVQTGYSRTRLIISVEENTSLIWIYTFMFVMSTSEPSIHICLKSHFKHFIKFELKFVYCSLLFIFRLTCTSHYAVQQLQTFSKSTPSLNIAVCTSCTLYPHWPDNRAKCG